MDLVVPVHRDGPEEGGVGKRSWMVAVNDSADDSIFSYWRFSCRPSNTCHLTCWPGLNSVSQRLCNRYKSFATTESKSGSSEGVYWNVLHFKWACGSTAVEQPVFTTDRMSFLCSTAAADQQVRVSPNAVASHKMSRLPVAFYGLDVGHHWCWANHCHCFCKLKKIGLREWKRRPVLIHQACCLLE